MNSPGAGAIVKTCGWGCSGGCLGGECGGFAFEEFALLEACAGADQGDQVGCVDRAPAVLGGLDELERHRDPGGPGPLDAVVGRERRGGDSGVVLVLGLPDLGQGGLRPGVGRLGQSAQHVGDLVEPAPLLTGAGEHLTQRGPEAQRPVPDREHGGAHPAALARAQQVRPGLGGLAVPVVQGDQLLGPVGAHPDHDQQAHLVLLEADLEVDPVDPHVHVVAPGQGAGVERGGLVLPLRGQPRDRGGRQARTRAQELLQRGPEVRGGQPVQVQQGQHLSDLRRLPGPRGQDRRGEPGPRPGDLIDTLVVDPRRPHRHRTRGRGDLPLLVVPVANHQSTTVLVELVGEHLDVGGDLGLQRRGEHRPGTITHELIKHRPRHRGCGLAGHLGVLDYREHGRTFPTSASTPAMIELVWASDHPREGAPLSRHQAEDPSTGFDHCSVQATISRTGVQVQVMLADEAVQIKEYGTARQLTLFENDAPVLQVLTSDTTATAVGLLYWLRARWRIENMFKYASGHNGIDALADYAMDIGPDTGMVTNPARLAARKTLATAQAELATAERALPQLLNGEGTPKQKNAALPGAHRRIEAATAAIEDAKTALKPVPAKVLATDLDPDAKLARPRIQRRGLQMVLRLLAFNAEAWLAEHFNAYLADPDEYRAIARNLLHLGGHVDYTTQTITVTLDRPDSPRVARALQLLTEELNATPARLPGDRRPLTYQVAGT